MSIRSTRLIARASLLLGLLTTFTLRSVQAQERLNIAPPPSGSLSQSQLAQIAADIHRLESNPFAPDAREANAALLQWLTGSPDVNVSLCGTVTGQLMDQLEDYAFRPNLTMQQIFSMAAFAIEHTDEAEDPQAVQRAGVNGVINTYAVIKASGRRGASNAYLDGLLAARESGTLDDEIGTMISGCH